MRHTMRQLFEQHQHWNVAEAADGQEAVDKTARLRPDLVVLDFAMPGMNGLQAGDAIRRLNPRVPLILFTAYKDNSLEHQAFNRGFSVVLSKGESANRLIDSARVLVKYGKAEFDARRHSRIQLEGEATIYSDRRGFLPARISDISESGFAATLPVELPPGEVVQAELQLRTGVRKLQAIVRNRNVFRHGFEILGTTLAEEMKALMKES